MSKPTPTQCQACGNTSSILARSHTRPLWRLPGLPHRGLSTGRLAGPSTCGWPPLFIRLNATQGSAPRPLLSNQKGTGCPRNKLLTLPKNNLSLSESKTWPTHTLKWHCSSEGKNCRESSYTCCSTMSNQLRRQLRFVTFISSSLY